MSENNKKIKWINVRDFGAFLAARETRERRDRRLTESAH